MDSKENTVFGSASDDDVEVYDSDYSFTKADTIETLDRDLLSFRERCLPKLKVLEAYALSIMCKLYS